MAKERTVCDRLNLALAQIEAATVVADGPVKEVLTAAVKAARDAHIEIQATLRKLVS